MSYRPVAAGHAAQEAPRTIVQDNISELVERARTFLDMRTVMYDTARKEIIGIEATANAASTLARHPELRSHQRYEDLGVFISALWNECCQEKIIIYPFNTPNVRFIGDTLLKEKTLIITGNTGEGPGYQAKGPIIIKGLCGNTAGYNATGLLITPTDISDYFRGTHVTSKQYAQNTALQQYIDQLIAAATEDPAAAEREFGDGIKITAKIKKLIRRRH